MIDGVNIKFPNGSRRFNFSILFIFVFSGGGKCKKRRTMRITTAPRGRLI
jgi:hypothetical protein